MPRIGIRITEDFHEELKTVADVDGVSVSDFVRQAVLNEMLNRRTPSNGINPETVAVLKSQVESLENQLTEKDNQIAELHKLVAMANTATTDAMRQLESSQKQLEDLRTPKPSWRLFRPFRKEV